MKKFPVFFTEQVAERNLLKGACCVVEDWILAEEETLVDDMSPEVVLSCLPVCVIVSFPGASGKSDCMEHSGRYPIAVMKKDWYVDHAQSYPKLRTSVGGSCRFAQLFRDGEFCRGRTWDVHLQM